LKDFLEHEVLEAALFGHDGVPRDVLDLARNRIAVEVGQLYAILRDDRQIAVTQEEQIAGVIQDGGYIAGDEIFVVTQSNHRWWTITARDDLVWLVWRGNSDREDSRKLLHGLAHCLFQRDLVFGVHQAFLDEMSDNLGVRLGAKLVTF